MTPESGTYRARWRYEWVSDNGTAYKIEIRQRGYGGSATARPLGRAPILKRESADNGILGTSLEIYAQCDSDQEYAELYTSDATEFLVVLLRGNTEVWSGFVSPELYSEPDIAPPYDVQIIATDGLGELKLYDFQPEGRRSLIYYLRRLLTHTGFDEAIYYVNTLKANEESSANNLLNDIQVDLDYMTDVTVYDVLVQLLTTFHMSITQYDGAWFLWRETDISFQGSTITARTHTGTTKSITYAAYGSMTSAGFWPIGNSSSEVIPAKNKVEVLHKYVIKDSMLVNPDMTWQSGQSHPNGWSLLGKTSHRTYRLDSVDLGFEYHGTLGNVPVGDGGSVGQTMAVDQDDEILTLTFRAQAWTAGRYLAGPLFEKSAAELTVVIAVASGGTMKCLKKGLQGMEWVNEASKITLSINDVGVVTDNESLPTYSIEIPGIPMSGILLIEFRNDNSYNVLIGDGDSFSIAGAYLRKYFPAGFRDVIIIDNDARGAEGEKELVSADLPDVDNAQANMLDIFTYGSSTPTTGWTTSKFSSMSFIDLMARDYALSVALPRLRVNGKFNVPATTPPMFFRDPSLNMYTNTAMSWDLLNDEVTLELISLPAAAITVQSETITEIDESEGAARVGTTSSSRSAASSSSGELSAHIANTTIHLTSDEKAAVEQWRKVNVGTNELPVWQLRASLPVSSTGDVIAGGAATTGETPTAYTRLDPATYGASPLQDTWKPYDPAYNTQILCARLGYNLNSRVHALEQGGGGSGGGGTVVGVMMNSTMCAMTAGVVDLGTVITDISGKQDAITNSNKLAASLIEGLATVATTGDYRSLSNTPDIPVETTVAGWGFTKNTGTVTCVKMNNTQLYPSGGIINLGTVVTDISGKQDVITNSNKLAASLVDGLATVATTGDYRSLSNTPDIPVESTVQGWGFTKNAGTITSVMMNNQVVATSGIANLGTVITAHQDISGKEDKSNKVDTFDGNTPTDKYPSARGVHTALQNYHPRGGNSSLDFVASRLESTGNSVMNGTAHIFGSTSNSRTNIYMKSANAALQWEVSTNQVILQSCNPAATESRDMTITGYGYSQNIPQLNLFADVTYLRGRLQVGGRTDCQALTATGLTVGATTAASTSSLFRSQDTALECTQYSGYNYIGSYAAGGTASKPLILGGNSQSQPITQLKVNAVSTEIVHGSGGGIRVYYDNNKYVEISVTSGGNINITPNTSGAKVYVTGDVWATGDVVAGDE